VLRGVVVLVVVGLLTNAGYLVGSFALAARNTDHDGSWSLWAADVTDPWAHHCAAQDALSVYDPFTATPLAEPATQPTLVTGATFDGRPVDPATEPPAQRSSSSSSSSSGRGGGVSTPSGQAGSPAQSTPTGSPTGQASGAGQTSGTGTPAQGGQPTPPDWQLGRTGASTGFVRNSGYYLGYQPPVPVGTGAASALWGSLQPSKGQGPDNNTGDMRTSWYQVPGGLTGGAELGVLVAGSISGGNALTAEYGRLVDGQVVPVGSAQLQDSQPDARWRTVLLDPPPPGTELVRLHARDTSGGPGGWLAFAAPSVQRPEPLARVLPAGGSVALGWQIAFEYPCLRQSRIHNGITEPASAAVLWTSKPASGTQDGTWQAFRGGLYAPLLRSQSVLELPVRVRGQASESRIEVLLFESPLARDAYTVTTRERRTDGWSMDVPSPTRTLNPTEGCVQHAAATKTDSSTCAAKK
jgi:hypothetical protein